MIYARLAEIGPIRSRLGAELHRSKPGGSYSLGVSAANIKRNNIRVILPYLSVFYSQANVLGGTLTNYPQEITKYIK